jgi:hypothetical protein
MDEARLFIGSPFLLRRLGRAGLAESPEDLSQNYRLGFTLSRPFKVMSTQSENVRFLAK